MGEKEPVVTKFSIVIPFYNRPAATRRAISSVLAQSFPEFEIVAVDDGSPEQSPDQTSFADSRVKLIRQSNRGPGAARNTGLAAATGEYVIYLDSDDELAPDALQAFWSASEDGTRDVVVGGCSAFHNGGWVSWKTPQPYRDNVANAAAGRWLTGSVAIRRALCPSVSETRMPWEMAECYLAAAAASANPVAFTDAVVLLVNAEDSQSLSTMSDHMEPWRAGSFWGEMKTRFSTSAEQDEVFDLLIFRSAFALFHLGELEKGEALFASISREALPRYSWYGSFQLIWFAHRFGFRRGLSVQSFLSGLRRGLRGHRRLPTGLKKAAMRTRGQA